MPETQCLNGAPSEVKLQPKLGVKGDKVVAQEKLEESFRELTNSLCKTKEAFGTFKTKCFFFPEPEFNKSFTESLKQVGSAVSEMGKVFSLFREKTEHVSEEKPKSSSALKSEFNNSADHSDVLAKVSLTPPTSEAGNDDEPVVPARNSARKRTQESRNKPAKKPKRSLMDDYVVVGDDVGDNKVNNGAGNTSTTEAEYEVESIINFKKIQGQFFYKVSWKGYSIDDCTWEPSDHLTDCEEILLEFYRKRLLERERTSNNELNNHVVPLDPTHQQYLRQALTLHITKGCTESDKAQLIKQMLSMKLPASKMEINDLMDKALLARKVERYSHIKQVLLNHIVLQDVGREREKQLAKLRMWERKINSVCSDPAKIVVENIVDLELPPLDFIYINELKEGQGVTIPNDPLLGCECKECCSNQSSCCATQMNSWFAYNKYGRLRVSLGTPIYECNTRCVCPATCINRVVQKGRWAKLSIFRTENGRGWGVKALENIKKDSFVVEYVGEVITSEEAEHRGQTYDKKGCTYLFDMDFNKGDQNPYTVDAAKYGNVSHFINHSCDPNLVVFNIWVNCLDPDLPRLALFACRDIKKGEELTFDYNSGLESEQIKTESSSILKEEQTDDEDNMVSPEKTGVNCNFVLKTPKGNRGLKYGKTECRCGAANCRKYFF